MFYNLHGRYFEPLTLVSFNLMQLVATRIDVVRFPRVFFSQGMPFFFFKLYAIH